MEITGKIIAVMPAQGGVSQRSGNPWKSQDYVIETMDGQYSRKCCFRVFGEDRIAQFNIQQGETCTVSFDIDAHEYNGRWYNDIRAYQVLHGVQQPQPAAPQQQYAGAPQAPFGPVAQQPAASQPGEDLPF